MTIFQGNFPTISLIAAAISVMFSAVIWLFVDQLLPFIFILSPFFLLLGIPVGLPIWVCCRNLGIKAALWAASIATLLLFITLPNSFAFFITLQLIMPAAFVATIANLQQIPAAQATKTIKGSNQNKKISRDQKYFIPLSAILSLTAFFVVIINLILAAFISNTPAIAILLDASIREMIRILVIVGTFSPIQINQFEMLLRMDHYALITRVFALYSFIVILLNFYIVSRLKGASINIHRPRDFWPYDAASLPRIQLVLLIGASLLSLLPLDLTLQNCLNTLIMILMLSFTLAGLAAIHLMTHGKTWRPLLLCAVYGFLLPLSASFVLAFWGIFISNSPLLQRYKNNPQPPL